MMWHCWKITRTKTVLYISHILKITKKNVSGFTLKVICQLKRKQEKRGHTKMQNSLGAVIIFTEGSAIMECFTMQFKRQTKLK